MSTVVARWSGAGWRETHLRRPRDYRCRHVRAYCRACGVDVPSSGCARSARRPGAIRSPWLRVPRMGCNVDDQTTRPTASLTVRRVFEPSRLASACLTSAYAQVVPTRRRPVRSVADVVPALTSEPRVEIEEVAPSRTHVSSAGA